MTDALALVRREMKRRGISIAELAHKTGFGVTSIYSIFRRKQVTVQHLCLFCEALNYNFFKEIGTQYSFSEPASEDVATLQEKVKEQELEIEFLRRTLKDLMGK